MKMRRIFITLSAVAIVATPASAQEQAIVVFMRGSAEDAAASLASLCVLRGIPVMDQGTRHVVCGAEVTGFSGALTQALIGNSYSTTPKNMVRFTIVPGRDYVTIQATQWLETQMAFGQVRQVPITNKKNNQRLREALISAGAYTSPPAPVAVSPTEQAPAAKPYEPVNPIDDQRPPVVAPTTKPAAPGKRPAVTCVTCRD